jgi:hypothetical protein
MAEEPMHGLVRVILKGKTESQKGGPSKFVAQVGWDLRPAELQGLLSHSFTRTQILAFSCLP